MVVEPFIETMALGDWKRVVTAIELRTPANKAAGSAGRREYRKKQQAIPGSRIHLLEIDLLKRGRHTVLAPVEKLSDRVSFDLLVSLSRADGRGLYELWPLKYQERLASVPVPIADGIPDVALDLQAVFDRYYDNLAFARQIDYSKKPPIPLSAETREWIDGLLPEKGLRR